MRRVWPMAVVGSHCNQEPNDVHRHGPRQGRCKGKGLHKFESHGTRKPASLLAHRTFLNFLRPPPRRRRPPRRHQHSHCSSCTLPFPSRTSSSTPLPSSRRAPLPCLDLWSSFSCPLFLSWLPPCPC